MNNLTHIKPLISSIRIEVTGVHAKIGIWSRGGKAGTLVVNKEDTLPIIFKLTSHENVVYYNDWKWDFTDFNILYGIQTGKKDIWELRLYLHTHNTSWEVWNYDGGDPMIVASGKEDTVTTAFFTACDYVEEVEAKENETLK